ncbi:DUF5615 family PIN-like protein [Microcoleus sp. Pol12A5]|uniref:DUF5615 family PIN-like protein n=1 Tax=Microcoleus sp. Pol12A5 TaxID=3055392 RepID=UPI002FD71215
MLAFAVSENRDILTLNRRYFIRLHRLQPDNVGIIVCRGEDDVTRRAGNINQAIFSLETLTSQVIRVDRTLGAIYILSDRHKVNSSNLNPKITASV